MPDISGKYSAQMLKYKEKERTHSRNPLKYAMD
jgi:hypothetical protein